MDIGKFSNGKSFLENQFYHLVLVLSIPFFNDLRKYSAMYINNDFGHETI